MDLYEYLARAEDRIAECELGIAGQKRRIAELARNGLEAGRAERVLETFRKAEQTHRDHRARLLSKIDEQESGGP